jgi:hypothetical protein
MSWATIPRFPDYLISDNGEIMSYKSRNGRGPASLVGRLKKPTKVKGKKYFQVALIDVTGTKIFRKVHLLVLEAFVGPCPPGMEGCHDDGDAANNKLSNLRWDTHKNNIEDQVKHGTRRRGTDIGISVLTEDQVREIKAALPGWKHGTGRFFARKFGVGDNAIHSVKTGKTWSHV